MDSQSVKNTDSTSKKTKGYDGGKKIGGIKRHLVTDTLGLPLDIRITPANESERDVCFEMIQDKDQLVKNIDEIYADSGYKGERVQYEIYQDTSVMLTIVPRKLNTKHNFHIVPKRWIIERSFSWIEKCHRLWKNTERLITTSKAMVKLCFIRLLVKRFGGVE